MFSVKDNTQRYKSLAGFAIFPYGSDISLRLAICPLGRDWIYIISHWSEATIYRTSKASISRLLANISPNRKREAISVETDLFSLSVCNRSLGLAHTVFVWTIILLCEKQRKNSQNTCESSLQKNTLRYFKAL